MPAQSLHQHLHARLLRATQVPGVLGAAARHHLAVPGKQLRGRLAHDVAVALGAAKAPALELAAAVEMLHNASLVHDDIQDEDVLRRGRETVWLRFGRAVAINLGDHLLASSFGALAVLDAPAERRSRLVKLFTSATSTIACGQSDEILRRDDQELDLARYEQIARDKTGPLMALPIEGAAVLAGVDEAAVAAIREGGLLLGTAYQLADDVLDLLDRKQRGQAGADLREGKLTWPLLDYLERAPEPEHDRLLALLSARERRVTDVLPWVRVIRASGAVERTLERAATLVAASRAAWSTLPPACAAVLDREAARFTAALPAPEEAVPASLSPVEAAE